MLTGSPRPPPCPPMPPAGPEALITSFRLLLPTSLGCCRPGCIRLLGCGACCTGACCGCCQRQQHGQLPRSSPFKCHGDTPGDEVTFEAAALLRRACIALNDARSAIVHPATESTVQKAVQVASNASLSFYSSKNLEKELHGR